VNFWCIPGLSRVKEKLCPMLIVLLLKNEVTGSVCKGASSNNSRHLDFDVDFCFFSGRPSSVSCFRFLCVIGEGGNFDDDERFKDRKFETSFWLKHEGRGSRTSKVNA